MKFLSCIFLLLAISQSICLLRTKIKISKQQLLPVPQDLDCYFYFNLNLNSKEFPNEILNEINQYLQLYQKPKLEKNELLEQTAKSAIEEILSHDTFGQHSQIEDWQMKVPNDVFTEMCFNVNVTNSNYYSKSLSSKTQKIMYDTKMSVGTIMKSPIAPTPQMFAKNIIEALESEHLLLTLEQYTSCGVAVKEMDQTKFPNEYLVVLHLIKPQTAQGVQEPLIFTSCKDAQSKGVTDENIEITANGVKHQVVCMNEYEGGWTLIHTENKDYKTGGIVNIDDLGIDYDQIFIKTGSQQKEDYVDNSANTVKNWATTGFHFVFQTFQFGTNWYLTYDENMQKIYKLSKDLNLEQIKYFPFSEVQSYSQASYCYFYEANYPQYCSTAFSFKKQGGERLKAISDAGFISPNAANTNHDNSMYYDFQVYVR